MRTIITLAALSSLAFGGAVSAATASPQSGPQIRADQDVLDSCPGFTGIRPDFSDLSRSYPCGNGSSIKLAKTATGYRVVKAPAQAAIRLSAPPPALPVAYPPGCVRIMSQTYPGAAITCKIVDRAGVRWTFYDASGAFMPQFSQGSAAHGQASQPPAARSVLTHAPTQEAGMSVVRDGNGNIIQVHQEVYDPQPSLAARTVAAVATVGGIALAERLAFGKHGGYYGSYYDGGYYRGQSSNGGGIRYGDRAYQGGCNPPGYFGPIRTCGQ